MKKKISWIAISVFLIAGLAFMAMAQADDTTSATLTSTVTSTSTSVYGTASVTIVNSSDGELEKIESPEKLKEFKVMKRIGNTLYGIRLNNLNKKSPASTAASVSGQAVNSSDGELEKIESPEQLKEFKVMKRIGNALYGIRISILNQLKKGEKTLSAQGNAPTSGSQGSVTSSNKLEKISSPQLISLYEKIQKIGTALWGVKKHNGEKRENKEYNNEQGLGNNNSSHEIDSEDSKKAPFVKINEEMRACVSTAITTKDEAIINKLSAATESLISAIKVRGLCQIDALKTTGDQKIAVESCASVFQGSSKEIRLIADLAQKEAWDTYHTDLQACRPAVNSSVKIDTSTEINGSAEINESSSADSEDQEEIIIEDGGNNDDVQALSN